MNSNTNTNTNNHLCCICKTDYRPTALVDLQELGRGHYHCYISKYHPDKIAPWERDEDARPQSFLAARRLQLQSDTASQSKPIYRNHYRNNLNLNDPIQSRIAASSP